MEKQINWHGQATYLVKVRGQLDKQWSDWFGEMLLMTEGEMTVMVGKIQDQAALHALLVRIRDLGLPLILVEYKEPGWIEKIQKRGTFLRPEGLL